MAVVAPGAVEHLVGGAMEVHAVDRVVAHAVAAVGRQHGSRRRGGRLARQAGAPGEVARLLLVLAGQRPPSDQLAVGHERAVAAVAHERAELERARLVAVELERRQQLDVLERDDDPTGQQRVRRLGEALHAHDARQHRRCRRCGGGRGRPAARVELGDARSARRRPSAPRCARSSGRRARPRRPWRARRRGRRWGGARRGARRARRRRRPRRPMPSAVSSRRTTGTPISGGSMSIPAACIIFGIEPRLAMPMPAHAVQSMTMRARRRRSGAGSTRSCTAGRWRRRSRSGRRCRSGRRSS